MKPIDAREVYSLSEFQRNAKKMIAHVKETRRPMLLTVNGSAEVVVVDAAEYQEFLDHREHVEFVESIKRSLSEVKESGGMPVDEFMVEFERESGV
jgi:prevent-host-death family protein